MAESALDELDEVEVLGAEPAELLPPLLPHAAVPSAMAPTAMADSAMRCFMSYSDLLDPLGFSRTQDAWSRP
jgi:hypothetical protein